MKFREKIAEARIEEGWQGSESGRIFMAGARAALLIAADAIDVAATADRFNGAPPHTTQGRWDAANMLRARAKELSE